MIEMAVRHKNTYVVINLGLWEPSSTRQYDYGCQPVSSAAHAQRISVRLAVRFWACCLARVALTGALDSVSDAHKVDSVAELRYQRPEVAVVSSVVNAIAARRGQRL